MNPERLRGAVRGAGGAERFIPLRRVVGRWSRYPGEGARRSSPHCVTLIPPVHRRGRCVFACIPGPWTGPGAWTPHVFPPLTVDSMKKCQRLGPLASPTTNSIGCADEGQSQGRPYPGHVPRELTLAPPSWARLQRCGELTRVLAGKGRHRGIDDAEGARVGCQGLGVRARSACHGPQRPSLRVPCARDGRPRCRRPRSSRRAPGADRFVVHAVTGAPTPSSPL